MKSWFWILGRFLCNLTMVANGFFIFFVGSKRQLRTKTNAFVVSLAMAEFGVGIFAAPSRLLYSTVNECISDNKASLRIISMFFVCASVTNLFSLVLERYIAVVKPLEYLTFMKRRRFIQMVFTSWEIPFLITLSFALSRLFLFCGDYRRLFIFAF